MTRRRLGPFGCSSLAFAIMAGVPVLSSPRPAPIHAATGQIDPPSAAVLRRARQWAGGPALDRVRSLSISARMTGGNYVYKLLLPGRFQVRTPWGTTTLDGLNIWQDGTPPPGAPVPSEISALARRNLTHDFVLKAVTFLLRAPDGLKVSITNLGPTAADGLDGQALLLTDPNGIEVTLFFAPDDGHLLGFAADGSVQRTGQPPVRVRTVWRLVEYREVEGVRFPFRLESRSRDRASGGSSSSGAVNVTEVLSIEINTVTAADFKQGEANGVGVRR